MWNKLTIQQLNSGLLQKTLSKVSPNSSIRILLEVLFSLLLGILAAILHAKLKIPLQLPGRQGMLFVGLLVLGRMSSNLGPAALISCLGSSMIMTTGYFSFGDAFSPVIYPLLGLTLDVLYSKTDINRRRILIISLIAGICWMMIPFLRLIISLFVAVPFHSFRHGPVIPFITHFVFGFTGGIFGFSLSKILNRH